MNVMIDVSIIIVNYNTKLLLADCLRTVHQMTRDIRYEVIVVDNASSDDSEAYIKSQFSEVVWINSGGNIGFGRANNLGASYATGKYLFLLNSDTLQRNNAVRMLYQYMETYADKDRIGATGCWLLDNESHTTFSYGEFPTPRSEFSYIWGKIVRKSPATILTKTKEVDFITGADLFLTKTVFDSLHGFDSHIFMYYEETDLQYRMAQLGMKRMVINGPQIVHLEGGSFSQKGLSYGRFMMSQISFNYYVRKHYKGVAYGLFRLSLMIVRLLLFVTTDWSLKEKIKAYKLVLNGKSMA